MLAFSHQLKQWRLAHHFSQSDLAKKAGISRPNLIDIESGKRGCTLKTLNLLAHALQVSPGTLLDQSPPPTIVLSRYELDELCKTLLGVFHSKLENVKKLTPLFSPIIYPIARSIGYVPPNRSRKKPWILKQQANLLLGPDSVQQVIRRCNKLAANL